MILHKRVCKVMVRDCRSSGTPEPSLAAMEGVWCCFITWHGVFFCLYRPFAFHFSKPEYSGFVPAPQILSLGFSPNKYPFSQAFQEHNPNEHLLCDKLNKIGLYQCMLKQKIIIRVNVHDILNLQQKYLLTCSYAFAISYRIPQNSIS